MAWKRWIGNIDERDQTTRVILRGGSLVLVLGDPLRDSADLTDPELTFMLSRFILTDGSAGPDTPRYQPVWVDDDAGLARQNGSQFVEFSLPVESSSGGGVETLEGEQFRVYGHSYMAGPNAPQRGAGIANLVPFRNFMEALVNTASAGSTAGQMVDQIRAVNATLTGWVAVMSLINDVNATHNVKTVVEAYRSAFAWLCSMAREAYNAASAAYGADWSAGVTTTPGSYVDYNWTGDRVDVQVQFTTGADVIWEVRNSGTGDAVVETFNTGGVSEAFVGVLPIKGRGAGNHTIRLTLASGARGQVFKFLIPSTAPPGILWAQEGPLPSYNSGQNTLLTSTYRAAIAAILSDFPAVIPVAPTGWDPATMVKVDGVHPNSRGVKHWTTLLEAAAAAQDFRQGPNVVTASAAPTYTPLGTPVYSSYNFDGHVYSLKTHPDTGVLLYATDVDIPPVGLNGAHIVIPASTGWTAGTYHIVTVYTASSTPDGPRTVVELNLAPAASSTAGGTGVLTP